MTGSGELTTPRDFDPPGPGPLRVVVVGAGFAGLAATKVLGRRRHQPPGVQVTLLDQRNHHVFTPFLYQVATALLEPTAAADPVRDLIRGMTNVEFRLAVVKTVNFTLHRVETDRGPVSFDYLILAAGAVNDYFQSANLATQSFALNHLGAAQGLRNHILTCFEAATWATEPAERARQLTFAVVGGGPTGVEFAAALSLLVAQLAGREYPTISGKEVSVVLIEGSAGPLVSFATDLQLKALQVLRARGVRVESGALVVDADRDGLVLRDGRRIEAATVVWAAGVRANPLAACFPATGSHGRVIVGRTLQVEGHPEAFVVGDSAEIPGRHGPLPMLAQVGIQSGRHAARSVLTLSKGGTPSAFRYRDFGTMAVLGRGDAVAQVGPIHLSGMSGWLAWLGVHFVRTDSLQIKAAVMLGWVSGFLFKDRPVRIITGPNLLEASAPDAIRPGPHARADLTSVNVANSARWGRVAALAWWSQDYPGLRATPEKRKGMAALRWRALRWRHRLTGDKSSAED